MCVFSLLLLSFLQTEELNTLSYQLKFQSTIVTKGKEIAVFLQNVSVVISHGSSSLLPIFFKLA